MSETIQFPSDRVQQGQAEVPRPSLPAEAQPLIRELYQKLGASKLLWGSDMPNVERSCTYRQTLTYLTHHCDFISEADLDQIVGGNAKHPSYSAPRK